jgi:hypothetical protein
MRILQSMFIRRGESPQADAFQTMRATSINDERMINEKIKCITRQAVARPFFVVLNFVRIMRLWCCKTATMKPH